MPLLSVVLIDNFGSRNRSVPKGVRNAYCDACVDMLI